MRSEGHDYAEAMLQAAALEGNKSVGWLKQWLQLHAVVSMRSLLSSYLRRTHGCASPTWRPTTSGSRRTASPRSQAPGTARPSRRAALMRAVCLGS